MTVLAFAVKQSFFRLLSSLPQRLTSKQSLVLRSSMSTSVSSPQKDSSPSSSKAKAVTGCVVLVESEVHAVGVIAALRSSNQSQRRYQRPSASYTSSITQFDNLVSAQAQKISMERERERLRDKEIAMEIGSLELSGLSKAKASGGGGGGGGGEHLGMSLKDEDENYGSIAGGEIGRRIKALAKIEGGRPVPKVGALGLKPDRPLTIHQSSVHTSMSLDGEISSDDEDDSDWVGGGMDRRKGTPGIKNQLTKNDDSFDHQGRTESSSKLHVGSRAFNEDYKGYNDNDNYDHYNDYNDDDDEELLRGFVAPRITAPNTTNNTNINQQASDMSKSHFINNDLISNSNSTYNKSMSTYLTSSSTMASTSMTSMTSSSMLSGKTGLQGIKDLSSLRSNVLIKPGQRIRVRPGGRRGLASLANQSGDK